MAKQKTKTDSSFIKPIIQVVGEKNILQELFEGDPKEMPELKSIGYAKIEGTTQWVSYVLTTKGKEVLSIEVDEPNHRAIAEEASKINFVNHFIDKGLA